MLVSGLGAIIVFVVLLTTGLLVTVAYNNARQEAIRDEYLPRLFLAERIRSAVIDQQSGLRAYLITGNEASLQPFYSGRNQYVDARDELLALAPLSERTRELRELQVEVADDWYDSVALPVIDAGGEGDFAADEERLALDISRGQIDDFRMINADYQTTLRDIIADATASVDRMERLTFAGALLGGTGAIILTIFTTVRVLHTIRQPLTELDGVVSAVDAGDLHRRVPPLRLEELDALGRGMNRMLDSLASMVREAEIQRSRFSTILESANDGIVVLDGAGMVTSINPAAARMFNTTPDRAVNHPAANLGFLTTQEIREGVDVQGSAASQPTVRQIGDRILSATISQLQNSGDGDDVPGSVWVLRDVTELARIDQMKNEFISIVSHELRTPLTSIKGFTDLILEGEVGDISDQQREFLKIVQSNSDRLVALINDMLDISRIESGRVSLSVDSVDLNVAVENALTTLRPLFDEKGLSFQTELAEDAPRVIADEARLQQILTNLISNACKYTPHGGWVTVRTDVLDGQLAVSVSDTGIGIPPEALPQVFAKFYRVDQPATRDVGGTGLGLAITKALVELHGGRITIASRVGVGTTVRFTLPTIRSVPDGESSITALSSRRLPLILVSTSDNDERERWESAIEKLPAAVIHTRSGSLAAVITEAELHQPDVIVVRTGQNGATQLGLDDLREELAANASISGTSIVAITPSTPTVRSEDGMTMLPADVRSDLVVAAVRDTLPRLTRERPKRGRVLVADGDLESASELRRILAGSGFEVLVVHDGLSAVVRAIEILPDAVILDVNMPKMGASEVLPQLRGNPGTRDIPIIVITGEVPDARPFFIDHGASDFFEKPVDDYRLVRRLTQLVRRVPDA